LFLMPCSDLTEHFHSQFAHWRIITLSQSSLQ
jgi:hypothetical protein